MDQRMEQRSNVIPVDNETKHTGSRLTADGRTLSYQLTVLQQPVRARACGQGAKSSADRRPVDPPPIVELQLFEGEGADKHDITFNMNANYFLFAELEHARPIAHGRMSQERNTPPVLTGTPVAGMVYLDRPKPAGYFIFPDLSVRHEGKYRLSFSLYEEVKQPKDEDKLPDGVQSDRADQPHVIHRLEVKSEPFHVFSAKKFPGLTESTSLSRMVAEQGCRVRIRRDVRMRRREPKNGSKEWDDYEDVTAAQRARASATPDPSVYGSISTPHGYVDPISRPRSTSNTSHQSLGSLTRRPSLQEMGQAYAQPHYGTSPHTPQQGNYSQAGSYTPAQSQPFPSAPYVQQTAMQPPPPQFASQTYSAPPPAPATHSTYYNYPPAPAPPQQPQTQYAAATHPFDSAPQAQRPSADYASAGSSDYRRSSGQLASLPPPPPPPQQQSNSMQQPMPPAYPSQVPQPPQAYSHTPSSASSQSYQSIDLYNRPQALEPRPACANPPMSNARLPPLQTAVASNDKLEASSPISAAPARSYYSGIQMSQDTHKRSFGNVFSDRYQSGPLRRGERPSMHGPADHMSGASNFLGTDNISASDDDDNTSGELDPATLGMAYRRADGRQIMRALPGHN